MNRLFGLQDHLSGNFLEMVTSRCFLVAVKLGKRMCNLKGSAVVNQFTREIKRGSVMVVSAGRASDKGKIGN